MNNAKCEMNGILNVTQLMFFFLPSSGIDNWKGYSDKDIRQFRAISHGNPSGQILQHGHHQAFVDVAIRHNVNLGGKRIDQCHHSNSLI